MNKIKWRNKKFFFNINKFFFNKNLLMSHINFAGSKNIILILLLLSCISCDKPRQYARKGNYQYNKKKYSDAVDNYKKSLNNDSTFSVANYNMGNALMQDNGKDYAQAIKHYNRYLNGKVPKLVKDKIKYAQGLYNRGNALFSLSQENRQSEEGMKYLSQAAQDYKNAMLLNPKDSNAKYNYAVCMWLLKNNNNPDNNNNNQNNNNNSEINQMLNAMKNNEKQTISRVKKQKENVHNKQNEKDW
ncbi:MAG: tetratricopeptide repeat protein [Bacteroidales bacterium]